MSHYPRGIDPRLLISQVKNTMPYLFTTEVEQTPLGQFIPVQIVKNLESQLDHSISHFDYFRLCVSAHYLTCATPVPTDVDNQIRFKLWPHHLSLELALQMAQFVIESRFWDFTLVSSRYNCGASGSSWEKQVLGGHLGEWFTLSSAAYCALRRYSSSPAQKMCSDLFDSISDEVNRHSEIFGSLWRIEDGISCLKASANIAHNFGDLDRVMDMWELDVADPLRIQFYKLAVLPFGSDRKLRYLGRLWVAGELYKSTIDGSSMALENHRHFALRKPRCLRQSPLLLIPNGPFFDDWGRTVANYLKNSSELPSENTYEVIDALTRGWERLSKTAGYGRALRGIAEIHPQLKFDELFKSHSFRSILDTPQTAFEKRWNEAAIHHMDEIPSKA